MNYRVELVAGNGYRLSELCMNSDPVNILDDPLVAAAGEESSGTTIYRAYRSSLLTPQRVKELSRLRPARVIWDAIVLWLGILVAWAVVAWHPTWWTVLLAIPVIGTRYYGLFILGHDGMHRRLFPKPADNDRFCDLFVLGPVGAITRINNKNHLTHHLQLATPHDPDRHKHACFNKFERGQYAAFLTGLANLVPVLHNVFFRDRSADPVGPRGKKQSPYTARDLAIIVGWQVALLGGLTLAIGWWAYPVLWLLPVYVHAYLGDLVRSFLEHSHPESDDKADLHRMITYDSNWLERTLFAPMNMNFHTAHHLWTSIPYYNLPTADAEIRHSPAAQGLVWRKSYLGYLIRYWLALPLLECKPTAAGQTRPA